jgi:hypothetical protein
VSDLDRTDLNFILTMLSFARGAFESYPYDDYEFRTARLAELDAVVTKVRAFRNSLAKSGYSAAPVVHRPGQQDHSTKGL